MTPYPAGDLNLNLVDNDEFILSEGLVWGTSSAMLALRRVICDVAPTDTPILLIGESGTGKEILALYIHRLSSRRNDPFCKVNCRSLVQGSLPTSLQNSTNGNGNNPSTVWRGTVLLDNICELSPSGQQSLFDLLLDPSPISTEHRPKVRVISTAPRGLEEDLRAGKFSADLYFRLNGVCLHVPPLRHRKCDLPDLVDFLNKKYADLFGRQRLTLSDEVLARISNYSWPGNIRQLENTVTEIVATGDVEAALAHLVEISPETPRMKVSSTSLKAASREASRHVERELLASTLTKTRWNRKRAARELQISYKALLYKLKQLGLDDSGF